jgi:drug/metabolite transporter (DMT)-like permease
MAAPSTGLGTSKAPFLLLAGTVLLWGTGYWPTAVAAEHAPALMVTALRLATSAAILVGAVMLMRSRLPRGNMLLWSVLTGLLMVAVFQYGLTEAIVQAGPGNGAVLVNTNPLWVLVLAWIFLGERLSPLGVVGLLAGFVGVVLMVSSQLGGSYSTQQLLLGCALALIAAISWAIGVLLLRRLSNRDPSIDMVGVTAVQFIVATAVLVPIGLLVHAPSETNWGSGEFWVSIAWIGPVAALGVLFFFLALKKLSAARTSAALFLVPAVAVVVEIVRGNSPDALVLAGMIVAVVGVALAVVPREQFAAIGSALRLRPKGASGP